MPVEATSKNMKNQRESYTNAMPTSTFNQQCLKKQLTLAYAHIKVPNTSPAHIHTQRKIPAIRIKDIRYFNLPICSHTITIIIIIIIIMFIDCKWVDTRWQWSFNMLHMHGLWRLII